MGKPSLEQKIAVAKLKVGKTFINIPKLKIKRRKFVQKKEESIPISSIINILIKSAIDKAKKEKITKQSEDKSYRLIKQETQLVINGGYGTVSKRYGSAPHKSYVDYEKLFSYLGKFKSRNPYENIADLGESSKASENGSFVLADRESMDKIGRFEKYFKSPAAAMPVLALSLVPIAGLGSAEWEEIKMMMKFDPILYTLKTKTS